MMKRNRRILTLVLAMVLTAAFSLGAFAADELAAADEIKNDSVFASFTGTVTEVHDYTAESGSKFLSLTLSDGSPVNMIVSKDTLVMADAKLESGAKLTGWYDQYAPMIMIYPPQYNVRVVAPADSELNVMVGRFDDELVSADNTLKLLNTENAAILGQDGKPFTGSLKNRVLAVQYDVSTRSIPAQTSPKAITVLYDKVYASLPEMTEEIMEMLNASVPGADMVVEGKLVKAPASFVDKSGTVMVPLRASAEALGYTVTWNAETKSVTVGDKISLTLDSDRYVLSQDAVVTLGVAPQLVNGNTYVPLHFYRDIVKVNNAYFFEGQIVIDNQEKMQ